MQENINHQNYIQEDEIDLKELFLTIWKKKLFIIGFTFIITVLAIVYALMKTPIYEAKAIIEIGSYKDSNNNNNLLDDANKLSQELNILFIDILKNEKERSAWVEAISPLKKQKNFIELTAQGLNNSFASNEVNKTVEYIKQKHFKIIDEIISKKQLELKNLERKIVKLQENELVSINENIEYTKTIQIPSLEKKIGTLNNKIEDIKKQLVITNANIIKTKSKDPSLTALNVMEKRNLEASLSDNELQLIDIENEKEELKQKQLPQLLRDKDELINGKLEQLLEEKKLLEQSLLAHNYKNSEIVGKIMTNDYAVKPKKKLIVVVAFVTAFILSIFIVFFMEFIKGFKEEDKELKSEAKA